MLRSELGHVPDITVDDDPAVLGRVVFGDLLGGEELWGTHLCSEQVGKRKRKSDHLPPIYNNIIGAMSVSLSLKTGRRRLRGEVQAQSPFGVASAECQISEGRFRCLAARLRWSAYYGVHCEFQLRRLLTDFGRWQVVENVVQYKFRRFLVPRRREIRRRSSARPQPRHGPLAFRADLSSTCLWRWRLQLRMRLCEKQHDRVPCRLCSALKLASHRGELASSQQVALMPDL